MKKLFILAAVIATSFIATTGYSQVYVNAHVGVRIPVPVVYETEFPGYAYYSYPAWNGHFRDRVYYEHYRPVFMRDHRFDRRFEHRGRW